MSRALTLAALLGFALWPSAARAAGEGGQAGSPAAEGASPSAAEAAYEGASKKTKEGRGAGRTVVKQSSTAEHEDRAASVVSRRDLEERLPRSAPDALRFEPGVYVQQTAHAQGSPYLRGVTGQQTVMLFDGVRLNNSTFRQGPNQYFFTIDARTIQRLEVVRGAASTRHGADALGGALLATPQGPELDHGGKGPWRVRPRASWRSATADGEMGGRAQVEVVRRGSVGAVGFVGGVGYRDVGLLRTGGPIVSPKTGEPVKVPRFAPDGVTQLGTGFKELTADGRLVWRVDPRTRLTLGYYDYRQFDAPRTDRCPPATAPESECLRYAEQFRTLVYGALEADEGPALAERTRWTLSYQNQHERRHLDRPTTNTRGDGRDDVYSVGTGLTVHTRRAAPLPAIELGGSYGLDAYLDTIRSRAWNVYTDVGVVSPLSRGQYLDGARYLTSGLWSEGKMTLFRRLELRGGGRLSYAAARASGDLASASAAVDRRWVAPVGSAGASVRASEWLRLLVGVDQGFRAPNLDDLTSRQQTGPGFQLENPALAPERASSLEAGFKVESAFVELAFFAFESRISGMVARAPIAVSACPGQTDGCGASQTVFQLVNLEGPAVIRGFDGVVRFFLPAGFGARATLAYAWGEGPNPVKAGSRLPLSRIPPLNGVGELTWRSRRLGIFSGAALRWAAKQDRLALADLDDPRIPAGGTPGFAVVDLRAGYRWRPNALISLVFENVGDAAYRYHGSAVNGPARGLIAFFEVGL